MGGISGHMMHPYDNMDLTRDQLITLMYHTVDHNTKLVEKIDGFGLHIGRIGDQFAIFRSKGDFERGGVFFDDIKERFGHNENAAKLYTMVSWEFNQLADRLKNAFEDYSLTGTTYNCEVLYGQTNLIVYPKNFTIFIHNAWRSKYACDGQAESQVRDLNENEIAAINVISRMRHQVTVRFNRPDYCSRVLEDITMRTYYMFDGNTTIREMYQKNFLTYLIERYNLTTDDLLAHTDAYKYLWYYLMSEEAPIVGKVTLRSLRLMLPGDILNEVLANKKEAIEYMKADLQDICMEFGTFVLQNIGGYINEFEPHMSAKIFSDTLKDLAATNRYDDECYKYIYQIYENCQNKFFDLEGIVVDFLDNKYKWTGSFGPLNHLYGKIAYK